MGEMTGRSLFVFLGLALGGNALGQGKPADSGQDELSKKVVASAGYIQEQFVKQLTASLGEQFDLVRAKKMLTHLVELDVEARDVAKIMNLRVSKKDIERFFGVSRRRSVDRAKEALKATVEEKDKRIFFGVMLYVMLTEFEIDPTSEFCQQACGALDSLESDDFKKLRETASTRMIGKVFGFRHQRDRKDMQEILRKTRDSVFMTHPMGESIGLRSRKRFDRRKFPKLDPKMTGANNAYKDGKAGGLPFDITMPPCPFLGEDAVKTLDKILDDR